MKLSAKGKEYNVVYRFEAAAYQQCVDTALEIISNVALVPEDGVDENSVTHIKNMLRNVSAYPQKVIELLYAGLIENHSEDVKTISDAREICKNFFYENPDDEKSNFNGLLMAILEQMQTDGFLKLTGLSQILGIEEVPEEKKVKQPTDHLKKARKEEKVVNLSTDK